MDKFKYKDVLNHEKDCQFILLTCKGQPLCEQKYLKRDIERHEKFCEFLKINCPHCNRSNLLRGQLQQHFTNGCEKAQQCSKCLIYFNKSDRYAMNLLKKGFNYSQTNFLKRYCLLVTYYISRSSSGCLLSLYEGFPLSC